MVTARVSRRPDVVGPGDTAWGHEEKMKKKYKMGPIGLTTEEIQAEERKIWEAVGKRHGMPLPNGCGYLRTPSEIHRHAVLDAMRMSNSCICYGNDLGEYGIKFQFQRLWEIDWSGRVLRKYGYNKAQDEAYSLSGAEVDAIFKAQKERISRGKIIYNVHVDSDGCSYNAIQWD